MPNSDASPVGSPGGNKRRKTTSCDGGVNHLTDLSSDNLAAIAEYLPKTSRALLAVALTAPPSSWRERGWRGAPSDAGRAILSSGTMSSGSVLDMINSELKDFERLDRCPPGAVVGLRRQFCRRKNMHKNRLEEYYGSGWAVLDFVDLEADLASKLTDDDVGAVLACIDAHRNLKKLHLTKCSGVVGDGLEPLRGSSVLEHIDFDILPLIDSLPLGGLPPGKEYVGKSTNLDNFLPSPEKAFSVLGSILNGEASSFRRLRVPNKWVYTEQAPEKWVYTDFAEILPGHPHALNESAKCYYFGFEGSVEEFVNAFKGNRVTETCFKCGRNRYTTCADCNTIICSDESCREDSQGCLVCDNCDKTSCFQCSGGYMGKDDEGDSVKWYYSGHGIPSHRTAHGTYCEDCRYLGAEENENH